MSTRPCPWQYEWKRPRWQSPLDNEAQSEPSLGVPLCSTSAQVSLDEFPWGTQESPASESTSLVLTVSLFSSKHGQQVGDSILLELVQQQKVQHDNMKRIRSRVLQWPGSALMKHRDSNENENKPWYHHLFPWKGSQGQQDGLVSIALCRRPAPTNNEKHRVDALDVVSMMSLGLVGSTASAAAAPPHNSPEQQSVSTEPPRNDVNGEIPAQTDLMLACLATGGRVHFYDAASLFEPCIPTEQVDDKAVESLFMGDTIYQQVQQSIVPLSRPSASVALSVPIRHSNSSKRLSTGEAPVDQAAAAATPDRQTEPHTLNKDEQENDDRIGVFDGSLWDATVEPSTAMYRTLDNVPALCVSAFDYVAVGGKGLRRRRKRHKIEARDRNSVLEHQARPLPETTGGEVSPEIGARKDVEPSTWWDDPNTSKSSQETKDASTTHWADPINEEAPESHQKSWEKELDTTSSSQGAQSQNKSTGWIEYYESGGFVTFLSLRHYSESRTVYLPFAPKQLSPVVWGGMCFLLVLGNDDSCQHDSPPLAVAIRVDSSDILTTTRGEAPSLAALHESTSGGSLDTVRDADASRNESERGGKIGGIANRKQQCSVRRFQLLPIVLPYVEEETASSSAVVSPIAVSSMFTTPPCIAVLYASLSSCTGGKDEVGDVAIALHSLQSLDFVPTESLPLHSIRGYGRFQNPDGRGGIGGLLLAIQTSHHPGHEARVPCRIESDRPSLWCQIGQGWSLIGVEKQVYFACWEGATGSGGAFVTKIQSSGGKHLSGSPSLCSTILPFCPFASNGTADAEQPPQREDILNKSVKLNLPFTSQYDATIETRYTDAGYGQFENNSEEASATEAGTEIDDAVINALESISSLTYREGSVPTKPPSPRRRAMSLSHQEKSRRLFHHCSSWEQLDDTEENRAMLDGQVPVLTVRLGPDPRQLFVLSLRKIFIDNGAATPFNQVLAWLCQGRKYFTASSIALDLLGDVDALRDLRRIKEDRVEDVDERIKLEGILDGIVPLDLENDQDSQQQLITKRASSTLTQLADMTVGCLVKGGEKMSTTLEGFLARNENYDPARASLMLSATAACTVSGNQDVVRSVMGQDYQERVGDKEQITDLLWPVRSLLQVAISRDYLPTALLLLNEAIPDELRRRQRTDCSTSSPRPPLEVCTALVSMIVASSPDAASLLLDLVDDESRKRFWSSLDHSTRCTLALVEINDKYPLLRQAEVRMWALKHVHLCIESQGSPHVATSLLEDTPSSFLKDVCTACLNNAGCNVEELFSEPSIAQEDTDGVQRHLEELRKTQDALAPLPGSGGLDFDLFIAALLLLENRNVLWREKSTVSTQSILDASCYLAGRKTVEQPVFAFNGSTVMKQCALSGNVSAGANLIGGRDGLVLKCCDVLIQGAGMNMNDAETFLLRSDLSRDAIKTRPARSSSTEDPSFTLTNGHRHVLWLLDEHVLSVKTYGEFETVHIRGRVDPVFAARSCFRTWLCLDETKAATDWLVSWLRKRLGIVDDAVSGKRLACAAMTRALIWPENGQVDSESDQLLANALGIESTFIVQLSQSCCGLIESIPPSLAKDVLRKAEESSPDTGYAATPLHVDV